MNISVVVATHRREELLTRTLASLATCSFPDGYAHTIVVENGTRGAASTIVENASPRLRARYLFEPVANKSAALNRALADVDDGLVVFIDDDVRFSPGFLQHYASAAGSHGEGHTFGGPVAADYEEPPPTWLHRYLPASAIGWTLEERDAYDRRMSFLGFNWAAFRRDLRAAGEFSSDFGPGSLTGSVGQESEMQRRLHAAGIVPIYLPDALVYHWVPRTRCSPEFALERAYKEGIRVALLDGGLERWRVLGIPVRRLERLVQSWAVVHFRRAVGTADALFVARFQHARQKGLLKGYRLARSRSRTGNVRTR